MFDFFGGMNPYWGDMTEQQRQALMQQSMWNLAAQLLQAGGQGKSTAEGLGGALASTLQGMNTYGRNMYDRSRQEAKDARDEEKFDMLWEKHHRDLWRNDEKTSFEQEQWEARKKLMEAQMNWYNRRGDGLGIDTADIEAGLGGTAPATDISADEGPGVIDTMSAFIKDKFGSKPDQPRQATQEGLPESVASDYGNFVAQYNAGVFDGKSSEEKLRLVESVMGRMGPLDRMTREYQKLNQIRQQLRAK